MFVKFLTVGAVIGAMALTPTHQARADAGDFIGGAIVGGLVTGAIMCANRPGGCNNNRTTTTRTVRPAIPATQQGRETQTALNFFGFNAGVVDGQVGSGTRSAIERYQAVMGYPVNGREFASYQFDFLMDAYYWSINGGQSQTRLAGQPLLLAYRDNLQLATQPQPPQPIAPPPATTVIVAPPQTTTTATTVVAAEEAPATLPNLFAGSGNSASLANHCNSVMLQTTTNGGYTTLATMTDANGTLREQFCVARSYAISQGEDLMQGITGLTQAQIAEQCEGFGTMLGAEADKVSLQSQAEVTTSMREFALGTGMPPADLAATSRVCLAVGYAQDDMRMAVGSALMLVSMGEAAYGELLGHHLLEGFGTTNRPDLAAEWYDAALTALESGAAPAFMPGQPERVQLIRAASQQLSSNQTVVPAPIPAATENGGGLPVFSIDQ